MFLCCDIQEKLHPHVQQSEAVQFAANRLLDAAQALDQPIFVSEQVPDKLGHTLPVLRLPHQGCTVVAKSKFSMLCGELSEALDRAEGVVLFGLETHICVLQTVQDLLQYPALRGKSVVVAADAVSSIHTADHVEGLAAIRQMGALVAPADAIIFALLGDASHPKFKTCSTIVKNTRPLAKSPTGITE